MELSIEEIMDLAEFVGLDVTNKLSEDDSQIAVTIHQQEVGFAVENDNGIPELYRCVAVCDGCEVGEVQPLGKPMRI